MVTSALVMSSVHQFTFWRPRDNVNDDRCYGQRHHVMLALLIAEYRGYLPYHITAGDGIVAGDRHSNTITLSRLLMRTTRMKWRQH